MPMCPRDSSRTKTPTPSWGANTRPAVSSIRARPSRRDTRPRASSTEKITTRVYVIAAAMWAVSVCSPNSHTSRAYWGSSVVMNETSDRYQPCSSTLPCSMSQAISRSLDSSEFSG